VKILLVEPDVVLAKTYIRALEHAGHKVIAAGTAQAAIHAADIRTPDLVILEMQLVSHSGIEFLYEFRSYEDWREIPVLAHSQVPMAEFVDTWELLQTELGVAKYLYKPRTTLAKLLQTVNGFATVKQ
jgi:DNA-binding response OmpR family regulator